MEYSHNKDGAERKPSFGDHSAVLEHVNRESTASEKVTRTMFLFTLFIATAAWIGQFDLGYGGTVLQIDTFKSAFGKCGPDPASGAITCHISALQQSLVSLTGLFQALGGTLAGFAATYLGRRGSLQVGALLVAVGAAGMLGTSSSFLNYMVCKCVGGIGIGVIFATAIIYGVECTSPHRRGLLLSVFTIGLASGNLGASGVCAGTSTIKSNWAWKVPIACQIPFSVFLGLGVMLFPESPRWLVAEGKDDKARRALARFHARDPNSDHVTAHLDEIRSYIEFEKEVASSASFLQIFHKQYIRRTMTSVFMMVATVLTGLQFVAPYTAIFIGSLGIGSPFVVTVIVSSCFTAGSLFGGFIIEFIGRRRAMLVGFGFGGAVMLTFSAVSSGLGSTSEVARRVLVACLCIWGFSFSSCIAPSGWIGSTEMHTLRLRAHGQALAININSIFGFASQFWTPYMISPDYGNMGTNIGYFYFGLTVIIWIIVFVLVPETARLKLEQIDDYFESGVPAWKTSIKKNKAIAAANLLRHAEPSTFAHEDSSKSLKVVHVERTE